MKTKYLTIIILFVLFVVSVALIFFFATATEKEKNVEMKEKDFTEVIFERKSVRNFRERPVDKAMLEKLMRAGMAAPSARNLQPWAFVAVTDRAVLDQMAEGLPYAKMLTKASAAIIVCGDLQKAATDVDTDFWVQDCSAATQNILLAAEAMGLGAVWTAAFPYQERIDVVVNAVGLPENVIPLNVIPLGYPVGTEKAKDKYKPENIHWEKW